MTRTRAKALTTDELLAGHTPPVRASAERLRSLIREAVPEAEERVYVGWHAVGFVHPEAGYFGAIFPRESVVKLCFEWGSQLDDPAGLMTGDQKRVRYVVIEDEAEIPVVDITNLVHAAIWYQLER